MYKTYIIDRLFEKYIKYSANLILKDSIEADKLETIQSKEAYGKLVLELSNNNYFEEIAKGNTLKANQILNQALDNYVELNPYYQNLYHLTQVNYHELRSFSHLSIISVSNQKELQLTSAEEAEFKTIYQSELDYFNTAQYRFDFMHEPLFNQLVTILISFSTILRLIKLQQDLYITDQNIDEYYLNNFLVSHGFLYYNNITYDKKKLFANHIVKFYNNKGSLNNIIDILEILNNKAVDVYEYYLFYDEMKSKYFFLKVKPTESFIDIFNNFRSDREEDFNKVVDSDDSWLASENDLLQKDIKFLKSKYFSIDSFSDVTDSNIELSFLLNKAKKYKNILGKTYRFDLEGFSSNVEIYDFMSFITLLSMKINHYSMDVIKNIDINENTSKFISPPRNYETNKDLDPNKTLQELVAESIEDVNEYNTIHQTITDLKSNKKIDKVYSTIDAVRLYRNKLSKTYTALYRPISRDSIGISSYTYLSAKYPEMKKYLDEVDLLLLSGQFLNFINTLEQVLMLYGQNAFSFKDIYSNLYLPKIIEIINFFKSLNANLLEFNNTLSIEKESRIDIISDSILWTGISRISNIDPIFNGKSDSKEYEAEREFENKEEIKDIEVDLLHHNIDKDVSELDYGKTQLITNDDKSLINSSLIYFKYTSPTAFVTKKYVDFSQQNAFVDKYSNIFDSEIRIKEIIKNENMMYLNGYLVDFYGSMGIYKELREKYNLTHEEFKSKMSIILEKHYLIFGKTLPRFINSSYKTIFETEGDKPYIQKGYKFEVVGNEIKPSDKVYVDTKKRYNFSDVLCIYEKNGDDTYYIPDYLNKKYRSTPRTYHPDDLKDYHQPYTGIRNYKKYIQDIVSNYQKSSQEEDIIGTIPMV